MSKKWNSFKLRIYFVGFIFFALAGLLVWRLFFIQVRGHDYYFVKAQRQYASYKSKEDVSIRGSISFKEKNGNIISAADVRDGFLLAVNPNSVVDSNVLCEKINGIISENFDKEDCLARANKKDDPYEVIAHKLDFEKANEINNLGMDGLNIFSEEWRFYPGNSLASQVLGFVGYKDDDLVGRYGLEEYYENVLKGEEENLKEKGSFAMLFFNLGKEFLGSDFYGTNDIVLTIEPKVQSVLEDVLDDVMAEWHGQSAGGIMINPQTGEILAMASKPDFNPNKYSEVDNILYFRNPLVSDIFEMGSIFKPLTLAAALNDNKITAKTTYVDYGYSILDGRRIENYDGKGRGEVNMQTVLNQSLNTGAIFAMQQVGKKNFLEYLKNYGFNELTEIDLPDEIVGHLDNLSSMRDVEFATASFGHGIAVSPIEYVVAASSLANGGVIMRPYVVDRILVDGGRDHVTEPLEKRRVLKEETSREITRMLVNVVDDALLGGTVKMDKYSIAAKTGTALLNKPIEEGGGYYDDRYFHSFLGYGPASDAQFLILLYVKDPQGVKYASHTLTYPFMDLMKFLFNYYEVPPDR